MTTQLTVNPVEDGAREAKKVVVSWRASASSLLDACVRIHEVTTAYRDNEAELNKFIDGLVEGGVLTPNEGAKGIKSPQLSKLRTIGERAPMLRDAELGTRLTSDYSTMYQLCVLDKQMSARLTDEKQRLEKLKSVVANAPEISRNFFASETKKEKAKSQRLSQKRSKASSLDSKIVADLDSDAALTTLAGVIDSEEKFDLVLMTPNEKVLRQFAEDYAEDIFETCFPIHSAFADEGETAAIVVVPASWLSVVIDRLLPECGFNRQSTHVLLLKKPSGPDITDDLVIVVAHRGCDADFGALSKPLWEDESESRGRVDPTAIADTLFPDLKRRLHVFAEEETEGWCSLIGKAAWVIQA
jgi:hypothetical protein